MIELRMQVLRKYILQYYQLFCNLSLDVVGGVICNMLALVHCFQLNPPIAWYIALPCGTWLIYLADHLSDVVRIKDDYPTPRHQFVKKYFKWVLALCVLLAILIVYVSITHYHPQLMLCGVIIVVLTGIHFLLSRINSQSTSVLNNKEFGVSFIYSTAIYIYPLVALFFTERLEVLFFLYAIFLLITYQNLLLCSIIEYPYDVAMNNASFIRAVGLNVGKLIFIGVSLSAAMFIVVVLLGYQFYKPSLLALYFLILAGNYLIYMWNLKLQKQLLYRKIAELLFWLPVFSLIF